MSFQILKPFPFWTFVTRLKPRTAVTMVTHTKNCIKISKKLHNINRLLIKKGRIIMPNLNQLELQHLRHLIGAHETAYQKLNTFSSQAVDPQIKQMFAKSAQDALNTKQKLLSFLNN